MSASLGEDRSAARNASWWQVVLSLLLVAGLVAVLVWLVVQAGRGLAGLPQPTSSAIVTASATVLVALASVLVTRYFERRGVREREQQAKRIPVYEEFVTGMLDLIGATRPPEKRGEPTPEETYVVFARFTERLIIWGSDAVIREWVDLRGAFISAESDADNIRNLYRLEELFLVIRRDLGLSDKALQRGDLLRLWINDLQR